MKIEKATLPIPLNEANFDTEVLDTAVPVLVTYGAEDVAACRPVDALCRGLAELFDGFVKVARVDIETAPVLADRFDVDSLPSVLLFHRGRVVGRWVGVLPRLEIERAMSARLPAA